MVDPQGPPPAASAPHRLRSGTAARLAGLPVTTLRVWERRYGVVAAQKSASGQRLYAPLDVARLRLLRQLTHAGHAIGTIATLDLATLQALATGAPALASVAAPAVLDAVVVGRRAAHALEAMPGCAVHTVYDDLDQAAQAVAAAAAPSGHRVDLLLVRLASLQPAGVERVLALGAALGAGSLLIAYAFGTEASAQALREAGATVRREPLAERDLARWVRDAREARDAGAATAAPPTAPPSPITPRRFDDAALARLARMPSPVACECLRHLSDIVAQLGSFEQYSADCVSTGPADAALHHHLARTAGAARTLFEQALQRVLDEAGVGLAESAGG